MAKYRVDVYVNAECSDEKDLECSSLVNWFDTDSKEAADAFIKKNLEKGYYCEIDNGLFLLRYAPDSVNSFYDDLHMEQLEQM